SRFFEADDLFAQRTIAFQEAIAKRMVGLHRVRVHADTFVSRSQHLTGCQELPRRETSYHSQNSNSSLSASCALGEARPEAYARRELFRPRPDWYESPAGLLTRSMSASIIPIRPTCMKGLARIAAVVGFVARNGDNRAGYQFVQIRPFAAA